MFIKHPIRLTDGQTCFKIVFRPVLRQLWIITSVPFFASTFCACDDDIYIINGICRSNAMNCKSLKENNILRHNWVSFWGKGPSFGRPSACLSFTCWSYLYFESSCFEQDLLQLSFLKNKQQFTENFKYHHSSYIAFYHITMFDKCLFW